MRLIYFDETKFSKENPFFFIGGILLQEEHITALESTLMQIQYNFFSTSILDKNTELHGQHIFNGIGAYRKRKIQDRIRLFEDVGKFITENKIPIRFVCVNVRKHQEKYTFPAPEYRLGLMLILEQFCYYLDKVDDIGIVFGDYEKDEISNSVLDFSQFKQSGTTPMFLGRPLGRLKDTIYFTHSHHSRFLQVADMIVYMANRYENNHQPEKWHDKKLQIIWENIKENTNFAIKRWPVK